MLIRDRLVAHVGHRGIVLMLMGVIWIAMGVGILTSPLGPRGLVFEHAPQWSRAVFWMLPGAVSLVASMWRRWDTTAWWMLIAPPFAWSLSYAWGWVTSTVDRAWLGAILYGALWLLVFECAAGLDRLPVSGEGGEWPRTL